MAITATWERITPNQAQNMLRQVHPRQKGRNNLSVIETYARQMTGGFWDESVAQTISLDTDNNLVDGWHRLHALIKANRPIRFLVARGVPAGTYANYDSGARRTVAFRMGVHKDVSAVLGVYRQIAMHGLINSPVTKEEFEVCRDFAGEAIERFDQMTSPKRVAKLTAAPIRAAAILQTMVSSGKTEAICAAYTNLVTMNFVDAPRSMTSLYKRLIDEHHRLPMAFALAWRAFCPSRFNASKIQIKDAAAVLAEVRDGPLAELAGAIRTADLVATKKEASHEYKRQQRMERDGIGARA